MPGYTWIDLLQVGAIFYLIYRVHRLERQIGSGGRPTRITHESGDRKVIPLLRQDIPPGPFGKGKEPPPDPMK